MEEEVQVEEEVQGALEPGQRLLSLILTTRSLLEPERQVLAETLMRGTTGITLFFQPLFLLVGAVGALLAHLREMGEVAGQAAGADAASLRPQEAQEIPLLQHLLKETTEAQGEQVQILAEVGEELLLWVVAIQGLPLDREGMGPPQPLRGFL